MQFRIILFHHIFFFFLQLIFLNGIGISANSTCYSTWSSLKNDLDSISSTNTNEVFTICPGSTLTISAEDQDLGIYISYSGTYKLQCGQNGLDQNCAIEGKGRHLTIGPECCGYGIRVFDIEVVGVTFRSATISSVYIQPGGRGSYKFRHCKWEENSGGAGAIYIQPYDAYGASSVLIEDCDFTDNDAWCGPVKSVLTTHLKINRCVFERNNAKAKGSKQSDFCGSAIHSSRGQINVTNSCFKDNTAHGPGLILIRDNFGSIPSVGKSNFACENYGASSQWPWHNTNAAKCPNGLFIEDFYLTDGTCTSLGDRCPLDRFTACDIDGTTPGGDDGDDDDGNEGAAYSWKSQLHLLYLATLIISVSLYL